jgi:methyl-accepting chemotaxis protein
VTDISQFVKEIALVVRHISQGTTEISYAVKDITEIMKQIETSRGDLIFAQRSIMAAVERHDRVMDYLIKRDGEKGSEAEET